MKKTKIIATISNHCCDVSLLEKFYDAGMDAVRINTAHQTPEQAFVLVNNVRKVSDRIAIIIDTKGPEIRLAEVEENIPVKRNEIVYIKGDKGRLSCPKCIYVDYSKIVDDLKEGDKILIDDGDIELSVVNKNKDTLACKVLNDGLIKGKKGVNLPSANLKHLPPLNKKDKKFIDFAIENDIDFIAHSFVRNKKDVIAVQKILDKKKSPIKIIAKIENQDGVNNIDEILDHAFGIMVARGDLAVEIPTEKIPVIQKKLVQKCIERRKPVIIATQMLQSMIVSPRPTRAEVSDVANACLDHTDALMLSGETAFGKYPLDSVEMMAKIAKEVESSISTFTDTSYERKNDVTGYLAKAAVKASLRLNTKGLVADSISGKTIRSLAAYRGESLIFAQCYSKRVVRELALSFGVVANHIEPDLTSNEFIKKALTGLIKEKHFTKDCLITVLAGHYGSDSGASYVEISTADNMLQRK